MGFIHLVPKMKIDLELALKIIASENEINFYYFAITHTTIVSASIKHVLSLM
jgi:hypothetical protein